MIIIDPPAVERWGRMWSHLASDESYDELHAFALGVGVPARGFDRDHYDVPVRVVRRHAGRRRCGGHLPRARDPAAACRLAAAQGCRGPD